MSRRAKVIVWSVAGFGLVIAGSGVALLLAALLAFDTDRDLSDFSSSTEARAFVSAHLPAPLPADAAIEALHYERWTDWRITARVRLSDPGVVDRYLQELHRLRATNDDYCGATEPAGGARYFLRDVTACGTVQRASARVLDVTCNTR